MKQEIKNLTDGLRLLYRTGRLGEWDVPPVQPIVDTLTIQLNETAGHILTVATSSQGDTLLGCPKPVLLPKGGLKMNSRDEFNELVRFSGDMEAEPLTMLPVDSHVTFRLTKPPPGQGALSGRSPSSRTSVIVQVLLEDLNRAKALLAEYRKTEGVPFS
jgi:hypothetical protein